MKRLLTLSVANEKKMEYKSLLNESELDLRDVFIGGSSDGILKVTSSALGTYALSGQFSTIGDTISVINLNGLNTGMLTEGSNLYFTDARSRAAISAGLGILYNSSTGVISLPQAVDLTSTVQFGKVGIGESSPDFKLVARDAVSTAQISARYNGTLPANYKELQLGYNGASGNGYGWIQAIANGVAYTPLVLQQYGGNVGINNTSPTDNRICINSSSQQISFGTADASNGMWIRNDGWNTVFSAKQGSMYYGYAGASGIAHLFYSGTGTPSETMRIADNKVGIGAAPVAKLQVSAGIGACTSYANYGLLLYNGGTPTSSYGFGIASSTLWANANTQHEQLIAGTRYSLLDTTNFTVYSHLNCIRSGGYNVSALTGVGGSYFTLYNSNSGGHSSQIGHDGTTMYINTGAGGNMYFSTYTAGYGALSGRMMLDQAGRLSFNSMTANATISLFGTASAPLAGICLAGYGYDASPYHRLELANGSGIYNYYMSQNIVWSITNNRWEFVNSGGWGGLGSMINFKGNGAIDIATATYSAGLPSFKTNLAITNDGNCAMGYNLTVTGSIQSGAFQNYVDQAAFAQLYLNGGTSTMYFASPSNAKYTGFDTAGTSQYYTADTTNKYVTNGASAYRGGYARISATGSLATSVVGQVQLYLYDSFSGVTISSPFLISTTTTTEYVPFHIEMIYQFNWKARAELYVGWVSAGACTVTLYSPKLTVMRIGS